MEQQPDGLTKLGSHLEISLFGPDKDSGEITVDAFQRWLDVESADAADEAVRPGRMPIGFPRLFFSSPFTRDEPNLICKRISCNWHFK